MDVVAKLEASWVTMQEAAPVPGHVCFVRCRLRHTDTSAGRDTPPPVSALPTTQQSEFAVTPRETDLDPVDPGVQFAFPLSL